MRFLVAVVLAGCASHAASGPSWPKLHDTGKDGGESLTPHVANSAVAAVEKSGADEEPVKPAAASVVAPAATPKEPGVTAPTAPVATPIDEPIITEDIVIEIDD
jgi:hypothetical protein